MPKSQESITLESGYLDQETNTVGGIVGALVELWSIDENGDAVAKEATTDDNSITDNGDGSYTVDMEAVDLDPGVYAWKVNGVFQDELFALYIATLRNLKRSDLDGSTLEWTGSQVQVKNDGIGPDHLHENVAGSGIKQNGDGSLSPDIDGTSITQDGEGVLQVPSGGHSHNYAAIDHTHGVLTDVAIDGDDLQINTDVLEVRSALTSKVFAEDGAKVSRNISLLDAALSRLFEINLGGVSTRRVLYQDTATQPSTGSDAAALPEYEESSAADTWRTKIRVPFRKTPGDKYLHLRCQATLDSQIIGRIRMSVSGLSDVNEIESTSYTDTGVVLNITDLATGNHEITIDIQYGSPATYIKMRRVSIECEYNYDTSSA